MCGIVGAVAQRPVSGILLEGLRRLEYRGYDSAGLAVFEGGKIQRLRRAGKVENLTLAEQEKPLKGQSGIAHTRWATHGKPTENNAHPHMSGDDLAIVHNGIIENFEPLRQQLQQDGFVFTSDTDTEVIAHLVARAVNQGKNLQDAFLETVSHLEGAFALGVLHKDYPDQILASRKGSPLVVGVGIGENFIASDQMALLQVTDRFIYLEEGDFVQVTPDALTIWDANLEVVDRPVKKFEHSLSAADKGEFRHFMMKEIYEQPEVVKATLQGRISDKHLLEQAFGSEAASVFDKTLHVQIIACGTSFHAGLVAKYWLEDLAGIPCSIEVASEYRYRKHVIPANTLFVTISQSGETADTLAALRAVKDKVLASLTVCNVPGSSLVRESDLCLMTNAGPEIGVASTKAFTTQLVALLMLSVALARRNGFTEEQEAEVVQALHKLPGMLLAAVKLDKEIELLSQDFAEKNHSLFLGRGPLYPVAMEGALKLKEISYIHAEAYAAGELKHGPLALVDKEMPVVAVAPNNALLDKLKANLQEVKARGGELFVFAGADHVKPEDGLKVEQMPDVPEILEPIVYTIPLQLLSYHVAVLKGTDVDQPRNLAKSVTVE